MYPESIEFLADGTYRGAGGKPGSFTLWDVGSYEPSGLSAVRISTANDAVVSYRFSIAKDLLSFEDTAGCRFRYRRAK
jgi:hypothetical protein